MTTYALYGNIKAIEYCSCGYRGGYWSKHRETSLRHGHDPSEHIFLGWIEVMAA